MSATPSVLAVLLDIDDTLVDTRAAFRVAIGRALDSWMPDLAAARREPAVLHWARDPGGYFREYTRGRLTMAEQREHRVRDLHATFGGPALSRAELRSWLQGYEAAFRSAWTLLPGALPLLAAVQAAGLPVGAVTNASRALQTDKLVAVGLLDRLPLLACVDDVGVGKPDPAMWHRACSQLNVRPGEAAYLGDELDIDARGARDAGLVGIWFDRHATEVEPVDVAVVRSLSEVPALLELSARPAGKDLGGTARPR